MSQNNLIKTAEQINKIRIASEVTVGALTEVEHILREGITTLEIDKFCENYMYQHGAKSAVIGYKGYPYHVCTSVNHVACHGLPNATPLKKGDILNVDIAAVKNGCYSDTSKTYFIGGRSNASIISQRIVDVTYESMLLGIEAVKPNNTLYDIAYAIDKNAKKHGFSVIEVFCGHGVGLDLHEDPLIYHYVPKRKQELALLAQVLLPGMVFTIEPILSVGSKDITILKDGWTAITKDRSLSAQWEHTILVTEEGSEILTIRPEEKQTCLEKL